MVSKIMIFLILVLSFEGCCFFKKRKGINPNLQSLLKDPSFSFTNPVVSISGKTIYFLQSEEIYPEFPVSIGSVYSIDIDGSNYKLILKGYFNALAISYDGKKIAVHSNKPPFPYKPESLIIIYDLINSEIDSYPVKGKVVDIEFANDTQYIYYSAEGKLYKLDLRDSVSTMIPTSKKVYGFDLFKNDEIYIDSFLSYVQINPLDEKYVIGAKDPELFKPIYIRNLSSNELIPLPDSCIYPYIYESPLRKGGVGMPYWFPDGNTIIFCYFEPDLSGFRGGELWILENLFEQIK